MYIWLLNGARDLPGADELEDGLQAEVLEGDVAGRELFHGKR
jgi:hypothetical protein